MTDDRNMPVVDRGDTGMPTIVYVLYLVSLVTGITSLIGVIMAYCVRSGAPIWQQSHYAFQIRTFWLALLFGFISFLLTFILVGFLTGFLVTIWFIVRCAKGLAWINRGEPVPDPGSWLFGDAPR